MECPLSGFDYIQTNRLLSHCYQFIIVYSMHYALEGIIPNNKQKHRTSNAQIHNHVAWYVPEARLKKNIQSRSETYKKKNGVKFDLLFMVFHSNRIEENIGALINCRTVVRVVLQMHTRNGGFVSKHRLLVHFDC